MFSKQLNQKQSQLIKGVAITLIAIHNFLHWIYNTGESEFTFESARIYHVLGMIKESPLASLNIFFAYLGHFGVQLFVFCSGYGLAIQYSKNTKIKYTQYLIPKLLKLYSLIILGIICFLALNFHKELNFYHFFIWAGLLFTGINNFSYESLFLYVGPWWYFSLAIQLYIVFPILYKFIFRYGEKIFFLFLCVIYCILYLLYPFTQSLNIPLYGTFIGHLPEFLLGMGLIRFKHWSLNRKILIFSIPVFILSNFSQYFYPLSFLSITIILLFLCYYLSKIDILKRVFTYIGSISMFIFIINGPLRDFTIPILKTNNHLLMFGGACIHFLIVILISIVLSYIYKWTFNPILNFIIQKINSR